MIQDDPSHSLNVSVSLGVPCCKHHFTHNVAFCLANSPIKTVLVTFLFFDARIMGVIELIESPPPTHVSPMLSSIKLTAKSPSEGLEYVGI